MNAASLVEWIGSLERSAAAETHCAAMVRRGRPRAALTPVEVFDFKLHDARGFIYEMAAMLMRGGHWEPSMKAVGRGVSMHCDHVVWPPPPIAGGLCECQHVQKLVGELVAKRSQWGDLQVPR